MQEKPLTIDNIVADIMDALQQKGYVVVRKEVSDAVVELLQAYEDLSSNRT
jgi:hypothetical protein